MHKKVLAIYYTQSGQMGDIISSFTAPIAGAGATVERVQVKPVTEYKFPWKGNHFFSVMPDAERTYCIATIRIEGKII